MVTTDQRPPEVRQQAYRQADHARNRMNMRRQRDDGLVGWLNERAGEWDLSGPDEAAMQVQQAAHPQAHIIFGTVIDESLGDEVRVTLIAAGLP